MKLKVTPEMVKVFGDAWEKADKQSKGLGAPAGTRRWAGIAAVLEIVERDNKSISDVMKESAGE